MKTLKAIFIYPWSEQIKIDKFHGRNTTIRSVLSSALTAMIVLLLIDFLI